MATHKSTRGVRFSRNRNPDPRSGRDTVRGVTAPPKYTRKTVAEGEHAAIEAARTKLMRARAVLDCTRYVLLYEDNSEPDPKRPSFFDAIDVARDLVDEVIESLDLVNLHPGRK